MSTPKGSNSRLLFGLVSNVAVSLTIDVYRKWLVTIWLVLFLKMQTEEANSGYAGPNTKIMRKAKMSFQSGQVKQIIRTYAVEIQTSDKRELEADTVTMKLRKAMGANCKIIIIQGDRMLTLTDDRQGSSY